MRKMRHREDKKLAKDHMASEGQSWDSNYLRFQSVSKVLQQNHHSTLDSAVFSHESATSCHFASVNFHLLPHRGL